MRFLKQSTASQTRTIGPFVDDTDFKTAEDGLTIANTDIRLKKNGAADVAKNSGGATADVNGCYAVTFDATDTDTVGELYYTVKVAGALQVFGTFTVLEEAVYDALFAASANAFTGAAGSTKVTGVVLTDTVTTYTGNTPQTGDAYPIVNSGTHGNAAIKGFVDDIGAAGAGLTAIPWNASWDAEVQSEVDDALVAQKLDHLVAVADADDVADNSIIAKLAAKGATADWSTFVNTTDSLEANRDNIGTVGAALVLGSGALVNVTAWTIAITGNITGNLSGSVGSVTGAVGSISGITFPSNFAALGINPSGHVSRVVLVDTTTTNTDMRGTNSAALASVCTEARLAELDAANLPADVDQLKADLPSRITKNTELAAFPFKMVDATDHVTAETGLTVTATRSIDGAAFAACANAVAEVANGWYKITLAAADLNGNTVVLRFTASGADTAEFVIVTQP